jgi:hypothetical protein
VYAYAASRGCVAYHVIVVGEEGDAQMQWRDLVLRDTRKMLYFVRREAQHEIGYLGSEARPSRQFLGDVFGSGMSVCGVLLYSPVKVL